MASERKGEILGTEANLRKKKAGAGGRIFVFREDRKSSGGRRCEVFRMEGQFVVFLVEDSFASCTHKHTKWLQGSADLRISSFCSWVTWFFCFSRLPWP